MLKPQDVVICLKLLAAPCGSMGGYPQLAAALFMSASEAHAAVRRASLAGLLIASGPDLRSVRPSKLGLKEFLCSGLRYVFPAEEGRVSVGLPTGASAEPLVGMLLTSPDALPTVWEHSYGEMRGAAVEPLYPTVPRAAAVDPQLYEWLALADAIRLHRGRIAGLAKDLIHRRLSKRRHAIVA